MTERLLILEKLVRLENARIEAEKRAKDCLEESEKYSRASPANLRLWYKERAQRYLSIADYLDKKIKQLIIKL